MVLRWAVVGLAVICIIQCVAFLALLDYMVGDIKRMGELLRTIRKDLDELEREV